MILYPNELPLLSSRGNGILHNRADIQIPSYSPLGYYTIQPIGQAAGACPNLALTPSNTRCLNDRKGILSPLGMVFPRIAEILLIRYYS